MATTEQTGLFTYIDESGNMLILYPVTTMEAVDGLPDALAGKAPAGYGLGEEKSKYVDDPDTALYSGWYRTQTPYVGWMRVDAYATTHLTQTLYLDSYPGCAIQRTRSASVFGEWEWLNPPMVPGVEYRTTERFSGKPVYVQAVNFGAMPNNTEKLVSYTTPSGYVSAAIDVWGHTSNGLTLPYESDYASFTIYASVDAVGMTTKSDQSGKTAVLVVKYCKE